MHGFVFNKFVDKSHFDLINSCKIKEFGIASLDDYVENVDYSEVLLTLKEKFEKVFDMKLIDWDLDLV